MAWGLTCLGMTWERVRETWAAFREALRQYEENLLEKHSEALREKDLIRLTELSHRRKQLQRLYSTLRKVEAFLEKDS